MCGETTRMTADCSDHHKLTWMPNDWFWTGKDKKLQDDCCQDYPVAAHNFKEIPEHTQILKNMYTSDSYKTTGRVTKLDWLKAEGRLS